MSYPPGPNITGAAYQAQQPPPATGTPLSHGSRNTARARERFGSPHLPWRPSRLLAASRLWAASPLLARLGNPSYHPLPLQLMFDLLTGKERGEI